MTGTSMVKSCGCTSVGQRNHNEDAFLIEASIGLMLVADGVGGHRVGEIASSMTCKSIAREIEAGKSLAAALRQANADVRIAAEKNPEQEGMASTVVALQFNGAHYNIAWIGDSRAYLWDGNLSLLTEDHSYVQTLLNNNSISLEQARHHPQSSVIFRAIGLQEDEDFQVGENSGTLGKGELLLLCSDGLNDAVDSSSLADVLSKGRDLNSCCDQLIAQAINAGGRDNITVVLAKGGDADLAASGAQDRVYWSFDPMTQNHTVFTDSKPLRLGAPYMNVKRISAEGNSDQNTGLNVSTLLRENQRWLFVLALIIAGGILSILRNAA